MTLVLRQAMEIMKQVDPDMKPTDPGYPEALVMMASMKLGTDETKLAALLGYDPEFVATVGSRLRSAGIWDGDGLAKVHAKAWEEGAGFFMDSNVASGNMMVVGVNDEGQPLYSMTEQGKQHVEKMGVHK